MLLQQRQCEPVQPREILAQVLVPHPRFVLAIGDIEAPVAAILDAPMAADCVRESLHAQPEAADVIAHLVCRLPVSDAFRNDHADRLQALPRNRSRPQWQY